MYVKNKAGKWIRFLAGIIILVWSVFLWSCTTDGYTDETPVNRTIQENPSDAMEAENAKARAEYSILYKDVVTQTEDAILCVDYTRLQELNDDSPPGSISRVRMYRIPSSMSLMTMRRILRQPSRNSLLLPDLFSLIIGA
jgi:hypothetical protein